MASGVTRGRSITPANPCKRSSALASTLEYQRVRHQSDMRRRGRDREAAQKKSLPVEGRGKVPARSIQWIKVVSIPQLVPCRAPGKKGRLIDRSRKGAVQEEIDRQRQASLRSQAVKVVKEKYVVAELRWCRQGGGQDLTLGWGGGEKTGEGRGTNIAKNRQPWKRRSLRQKISRASSPRSDLSSKKKRKAD